jgi:hypothetical protein
VWNVYQRAQQELHRVYLKRQRKYKTDRYAPTPVVVIDRGAFLSLLQSVKNNYNGTAWGSEGWNLNLINYDTEWVSTRHQLPIPIPAQLLVELVEYVVKNKISLLQTAYLKPGVFC